ncbi:MAG: RNA polymerase-binding protein DksA [Hydrogenophilales bacterium]|nr:RNA polymerase-binding protein DksA [Hydrogenophilales bacterium]
MAKPLAVKSTPKQSVAKTPAKPSAKPVKAPAKKVAAIPPVKKPVAAKPLAKPAASKVATAKKTAVKAPVKKVAAPIKAVAKPSAAKPAAAKAAPAKPVPKKPAPAKAAVPTKPTATPTVQKKTMPEKVTKPLTVAATPAKTSPAPKAAAPAAKASPAKKKKVFAGVPTEAEILQMSDDDYMNQAQLAFFKLRLQTMKDEILVNARETGEHLKENEVFADPNDRATVEEENMLEQRVRDRERKLLKKIDQSLARIDAGDYGYCLETGDPIGIPRLLARPTAELCIEAQEKHERREKLFAD